jgi:hypothetical protein
VARSRTAPCPCCGKPQRPIFRAAVKPALMPDFVPKDLLTWHEGKVYVRFPPGVPIGEVREKMAELAASHPTDPDYLNPWDPRVRTVGPDGESRFDPDRFATLHAELVQAQQAERTAAATSP